MLKYYLYLYTFIQNNVIIKINYTYFSTFNYTIIIFSIYYLYVLYSLLYIIYLKY